MKLSYFSVAALALVVYAFAQERPAGRIGLDALVAALENPDFVEVSELAGQVRLLGIDFNVNEHLGELLTAAKKGNRAPTEVATLVRLCQTVCQACRTAAVAPMDIEELRSLIAWKFDPAAILQEARVRGVRGIEMTDASANMLRSLGANEQLVALLVPDDKIPVGPLLDYQPVPLKRAEEYELSAAEGWLKVQADLPANSVTEFMFKHNGLFFQKVSGDVPKVVSAFFNKPTPKKTAPEFVDVWCDLEEPKVVACNRVADEKGIRGIFGGGGRDAPLAQHWYVLAGEDGRNAFKVRLANPEKKLQRYEFRVRWSIRTTPRPDPPKLKQ